MTNVLKIIVKCWVGPALRSFPRPDSIFNIKSPIKNIFEKKNVTKATVERNRQSK